MRILYSFLALLFFLFAQAQDAKILVSIVNDNLVFHSLSDDKIKYVKLSSNAVSSQRVKSMDYNPDLCIFYVITDFQSTPKLYTIDIEGNVTSIGTLSMDDGRNIYSCEAIAYNSQNKKTYASMSYPHKDYYAETLVEVNITNAECTEVSQIITNTPRDPDADFMKMYKGHLLIGDIDIPASPPFFYLFSLDFNSMQSHSYPEELHYMTTNIDFREIVVLGDELYIKGNKQLYVMDLSQNPLSLHFDRNLDYMASAGIVHGLTNFDKMEIFDLPFLHNDTSICEDGILNFNDPKFEDFIWFDGHTGNRSINTPGFYYGHVQVGACLIPSDSFKLKIEICDTCPQKFETIDTNVSITINPIDTLICIGDTYTLSSPHYENWNIQWPDNSSGNTTTVHKPGTYYARYLMGGCIFYTNPLFVDFKICDPCNFIFPNAFSPNQDGLNDVFKPVYNPLCRFKIMHFKVFNQWGEMLVNSNQPIWDGYYLNKRVPQNVYFYMIKYQDFYDEKVLESTGIIHIVY